MDQSLRLQTERLADMATQSWLYKKEVPVNDKIKIIIPTLGEILENEDAYYSLVSVLTAMPIDLMVQLDDAGIDFSAINDYDLFLLLFGGLQSQDTSLIFGDLDLKKFKITTNEATNMVILKDEENDITIDKLVHNKIAMILRKIHHLEKNRRKPANDEAREYMIKRARDKAKRNKRIVDSQIESLIVAMVNKEQFKYNYEQALDLSIYKFNESVRQIINVVDYEHRMNGVYQGTIDPKTLGADEFNWLSHK